MISKGGKVLAAECLRGRVLVFSNNWVILFFCYVIFSFGISPYTLKLYCETLKSINYNRTIFLLFFFWKDFRSILKWYLLNYQSALNCG